MHYDKKSKSDNVSDFARSTDTVEQQIRTCVTFVSVVAFSYKKTCSKLINMNETVINTPCKMK